MDNIEGAILIPDLDSGKWGPFIYQDPSERPMEEQKWYNILSKRSEEVVHFWRQFGLNRGCVADDLQRLSQRKEALPTPNGSAPLLVFRDEYKILFECLHAVFGLMMSNSHLCEQIHSMMRHLMHNRHRCMLFGMTT